MSLSHDIRSRRRRTAMLALTHATAAALFAVSLSPLWAQASGFSYDGLGRLSTSVRAGSPANGVTIQTSQDLADNRTTYATSTSALTFAVAEAAAAEGSGIIFTVTKTGSHAGNVTVNYATSSDTAISGTDFTSTSGVLSFAAADVSKTFSVPTTNDSTYEGNETFVVTLSSPTGGATLAAPFAIGTITDDETPPVSFYVSDASAVEGNAIGFTVVRSGGSSGTHSVNYATANATASSPGDYTAASSTLTFTAGQTTKTVNVNTVLGTSTHEPTETMLLNLSAPTGGATLGDAQGVGSIHDLPNAPPVANADGASVARCTTATKNVVANDTDPESDYPLVVTAASGALLPYVVDANTIGFDTYTSANSVVLTYTVRDSLGATKSGNVTVMIAGPPCP